jgi:hypothetical protein
MECWVACTMPILTTTATTLLTTLYHPWIMAFPSHPRPPVAEAAPTLRPQLPAQAAAVLNRTRLRHHLPLRRRPPQPPRRPRRSEVLECTRGAAGQGVRIRSRAGPAVSSARTNALLASVGRFTATGPPEQPPPDRRMAKDSPNILVLVPRQATEPQHQ